MATPPTLQTNSLAFYTALILNRLRNERALREQEQPNEERAAEENRNDAALEGEHQCGKLPVIDGQILGEYDRIKEKILAGQDGGVRSLRGSLLREGRKPVSVGITCSPMCAHALAP